MMTSIPTCRSQCSTFQREKCGTTLSFSDRDNGCHCSDRMLERWNVSHKLFQRELICVYILFDESHGHLRLWHIMWFNQIHEMAKKNCGTVVCLIQLEWIVFIVRMMQASENSCCFNYYLPVKRTYVSYFRFKKKPFQKPFKNNFEF